MPHINRPFMVDSIAAAIGPWLGIPAATALIESSAAAEAGGKTGLTALSAAVMFLLMLLFTPVALMIPKEATAPALILIGLNMFSGLRKVDLANFTDGLPVLMMVMITLDPCDSAGLLLCHAGEALSFAPIVLPEAALTRLVRATCPQIAVNS